MAVLDQFSINNEHYDFQDTAGRAMIAPTEASSTASSAHAKGSYFIYNGTLYQATADIASGGTITPGTNCQTVPNGLGGDVSDLKSATSYITGNEIINSWSENHKFYNLSGSTIDILSPSTASSNVRCLVVACQSGDIFAVTTQGGSTSRAYGFVKSNGDIITKAGSKATLTRTIITAPDDTAYLIVNDTTLNGTVIGGMPITDRVSSTNAIVNSVTSSDIKFSVIKQNDFTFTTGALKPANGTANTSSTRRRTDYISAEGIYGLTVDNGYKYCIYVYNGSKEYQGIYDEYGSIGESAVWLTKPQSIANVLPTWYIRIVLAKDDDSSASSAFDEHLRVCWYTDTGLNTAGKAADSKTVGENIAEIRDEILGFISFPTFTKGVRQTNGTVYTLTNKTITFSNYLYVGAGQRVSVILRRNFKYTLLGSNNSSGSLTTIMTGKRLMNFTSPYDYITMNVTERDENDEAIDIAAAEVNASKPIILMKGNFAESEDELKPDVPENLGVINMLKNAQQLVDIRYTPTATMPVMTGDFEANTEVKGMVYSSTRQEELFCANSVSLHTFMTAVLNPNSYLYTRESEVSNSKTYYGAVCSTFVDYCYGFKDWIPTTHMLDKLDGMEQIENQTAYGLKLGDMLLDPTVHARIVTKIIRNVKTGVIDRITISEAWPRVCRTQTYTPEQIDTMLAGSYIAYRYHYLYAVGYTPSPWVHLDGETEEPVYSTHLSPRRGDKAVWRYGEDIEIDVLDAGNYTGYKVYKDDAVLSTGTISGALITLESLSAGTYKVCLTDGANDSEFVYFNIVGSSETYTPLGNGEVKCEFSADGATATSIAWNYRPQDIQGRSYVIFQIDVLTAEQISAGEATVSYSTPGTYMLRVTYKNEFGLYYSDVQEVVVT